MRPLLTLLQRIWNISRSVLLGILLTRAEELGAFCKFSAGVADVDGEAERPVVTLENGDKLPFDLVIGADGTIPAEFPNSNLITNKA